MGEKCLKQYHTYHECCLTSNITTLSQFSNFQNLGLKYHLPRTQIPVCVWGGGCSNCDQCNTIQAKVFSKLNTSDLSLVLPK